MKRALELARKAKGSTFPNPAVGAVIVRADGDVVGEGMTSAYGGPHAEIHALRKAGDRAFGGTLYVTLEPCSHFGKTPPCVDAVIAAGIARVVAAVKDPNPLVGGKGIKKLRAHGIDVRVGLLRREAEIINEDFFWNIARKRPWITLKLAMTLDGRIADCKNGSKWITTPASRKAVQEIRRCHGAVAVGNNTLLCDDPKLTARCERKTYYPARIVFSSNADIPKNSYIFTHREEARTIVVVKGNGERRIDISDGIEYWHTGREAPTESIDAFLDTAYEQNLTSILVEGGQKLASAFLRHGFVNRVHLFYGNKIFGTGTDGLRFAQGFRVADCISLRDVTHKSFGDDFCVSGIISYA